MENHRYTCGFPGCARSFTRKEHLNRHQNGHDPANILRCTVCMREFNRNDSLQRHMSKHGANFTPNPARSKRACLACRTGKVKCDGNDTCMRCIKKGIECKYQGATDAHSSSNEAESPEGSPVPVWEDPVTTEQASQDNGMSSKPILEPATFNDALMPGTLGEDLHAGFFAGSPPSIELPTDLAIDPTLHLSSTSPVHGKVINLKTIRLLPDGVQPTAESSIEGPTSYETACQELFDSYFDLFHAHWPIIHRPSWEHSKNSTAEKTLLESVKMIGAWMIGTNELKQYAIYTHNMLTGELLSRLGRISSHDKFQQSLPASLCQAALLNIIFGLYYGNAQAISRVIMLRNILVAALREVGFFRSYTVWPDEKPGFFLPMRLGMLGERQRLAAYLFNVDTYLSILRDQASLIMLEDLHYPLQSTFALYNADGLHVWAERHATEPFSRSSVSLRDIIKGDARTLGVSPQHPVLIEDIHSCLCGLQLSVSKITSPREGAMDEPSLQKDLLRTQLGALKLRLDHIANQNTEFIDFGHENYLPMRYYFGFEDQSHQGWQNTVTARVESLLFDTTMLYYLMSLNLSADIAKLTQTAKYLQMEATEELSEVRKQALEKRRSSIINWVPTSEARLAVCQAVDILVAHRNMKQLIESNQLSHRAIHPVSYIALCASALVVWAYCNFRDCRCEGFPMDAVSFVELTTWALPGTEFKRDREQWIEEHGDILFQILGVPLCQCNVDFLMVSFQGCLPNDWSIPDMIAPGIFIS
ncbi:hypothetical protein F5884DRAFT_729690 [Xylogone sp. PMI_703]|nr:hypothetical protein F5884DRAFT_729690 [Xylogone sp. PMI_703]